MKQNMNMHKPLPDIESICVDSISGLVVGDMYFLSLPRDNFVQVYDINYRYLGEHLHSSFEEISILRDRKITILLT